jgi:DNA-binding GntR family transcriptional regulator
MLDVSDELDRQSYKPLYIQLAEIILKYANSHHLENGEALPSENELLSHFSVSRNTIRLAVDRLVQLGVAKKVRGQGTFFIKKKRALSVHYHYAFNGSVEPMGLNVTNKLIDHKLIPNRVRWIDGLGSTNWDETVWS